jgi:hypothetical protein
MVQSSTGPHLPDGGDGRMYVTTCSATRACGVSGVAADRCRWRPAKFDVLWPAGRRSLSAAAGKTVSSDSEEKLIGLKDERSSKILLPAAVAGVEVEDEQLLVGGEVAALHVGTEVVQPPEPAALARPL